MNNGEPIPSLGLTEAQCEAIVELGSSGSGGLLDPLAMSQLFVLGLVDVRSNDRRVVLTERGRAAFTAITMNRPCRE